MICVYFGLVGVFDVVICCCVFLGLLVFDLGFRFVCGFSWLWLVVLRFVVCGWLLLCFGVVWLWAVFAAILV